MEVGIDVLHKETRNNRIMKYMLYKWIQSNLILRRIIISLTNKLQIIENMVVMNNIHSKKNRINMLVGTNQKFICHDLSYIRDSNIIMSGKENIIQIDANSQILGEKKLVFYINGANNRIIIGEGSIIRSTTFFIKGDNNIIRLDDNISCYGAEFHIEQDDNEIIIGEGTTFHGRAGYPVHMAVDEGSRILIGEDCMLSNGIQIRSSDSHSIISQEGERLNQAEDVVIGNHCWLSLGCIVLKGTKIASNCIVGAGAICTKKYLEERCVIAGNPAQIVKRNVDWDRKLYKA